jgi:hypothetical protein
MILFITNNINCIDDICHLILDNSYNFMYMLYLIYIINNDEQNENEIDNL